MKGLGTSVLAERNPDRMALAANTGQLSDTRDPAPSSLSVHPASCHQTHPASEIRQH